VHHHEVLLGSSIAVSDHHRLLLREGRHASSQHSLVPSADPKACRLNVVRYELELYHKNSEKGSEAQWEFYHRANNCSRAANIVDVRLWRFGHINTDMLVRALIPKMILPSPLLYAAAQDFVIDT